MAEMEKMQAIKNSKDLMAEGRLKEEAGLWEAAAGFYQRVIDHDPGNRDAVKRLLMAYRRLKDSKKELSAITAVLSAVAQQNKLTRDKWLAANPRAAKLSKAMLKSLGNEQETAYGTDSFVLQLVKRKGLVERKISGVKSHSAGGGRRLQKKGKTADVIRLADLHRKGRAKMEIVKPKSDPVVDNKTKQTSAVTEWKRKEVNRTSVDEKPTVPKKVVSPKLKKTGNAVAAGRRQKAMPFSLFVINLRYLAPLEKIDDSMSKHVAFLNKYVANGVFLLAGRQVPRTGGIIIGRGAGRDSIERIMRQDPFVKNKLASVDILEFKASTVWKGLSTVLSA